MSEGSLISEEMRRSLKLGQVSGVFTYEVDRKWIAEFVGAFHHIPQSVATR